MSMFLLVVSWVIWSFVLLLGIGSTLSGNPDAGARWMMRMMGKLLILSCAAVLVFGISKLWLIVAVPIAFILPMVLMPIRGFFLINAAIRNALMHESRETGVPYRELVKREKALQRANTPMENMLRRGRLLRSLDEEEEDSKS